MILNEMKYCKGFFKVTLYLPTMLPTIAVMLMWYFIYYPDGSGLLNMFLGRFDMEPRLWLNDPNMVIPLIIISMTWKSMGAAMLLYYCALQSVNTELYEAAIIDGSRSNQTGTVCDPAADFRYYHSKLCKPDDSGVPSDGATHGHDRRAAPTVRL